jgi:hypothetical protein
MDRLNRLRKNTINEGYGLHRLRKNSVLYQGTTKVVPLEFLHFQHHICSRLQLDLCQPRTLVRGAGFQTRENAPVHILQGFSPGGGASNSILRDADDQANSSGLSLKPALTGFSQM